MIPAPINRVVRISFWVVVMLLFGFGDGGAGFIKLVTQLPEALRRAFVFADYRDNILQSSQQFRRGGD